MNTGKVFDLKVGYSCNNNCIHCVIKPNVEDIIDDGCTKIDSTYKELIDIMNSPEFIEADSVTITGGEPTLRKEFMRIIKYIVINYPDKRIVLQTNGRLLKGHIKEIKSLTDRITYVVAIHSSDEKIHNEVVGNKSNKRSPYTETMETLDVLKEVYGDISNVVRIEIVLSNKNYKTIPSTIEFLHNNGINWIGVSYPHLDGHFNRGGADRVREISLSYNQLREVLPEVYRYSIKNPSADIQFEEVPACMWRDEEGNLLHLPKNISNMGLPNNEVSVKFPEREVQNDFRTTWHNIHRKTNKCSKCELNNCCVGVWFESIEAYGDLGFTPITKQEIIEGGQVSCTY